jgi:hypothetical protein
MKKIRLNHDCNNTKDAIQYYKERAIQMVLDGFELKKISLLGKTLIAYFERDGKEYQSIYVLKDFRGEGLYLQDLKEEIENPNIVTSRDCNIESFLKKHKIKYTTCLGFTDCIEYQYISEMYGNDCAKRSGVPFMNHIDEGLAILHWIGASLEAKKAYCLHPIYQTDETFSVYGKKDMRDKNVFGISANVIVNSVEYRHVANNYLSTREIKSLDDIKLSPLKDVNDMLIADKIQNRKDFELYHEDTHPRSKQLAQYFRNWLEKLGISEDQYQEYKKKLMLDEIAYV